MLEFYPSDWRGDPLLRRCSLSARGLWIELIGLMHGSTEYGHLDPSLTRAGHRADRGIAAASRPSASRFRLLVHGLVGQTEQQKRHPAK